MHCGVSTLDLGSVPVACIPLLIVLTAFNSTLMHTGCQPLPDGKVREGVSCRVGEIASKQVWGRSAVAAIKEVLRVSCPLAVASGVADAHTVPKGSRIA